MLTSAPETAELQSSAPAETSVPMFVALMRRRPSTACPIQTSENL